MGMHTTLGVRFMSLLGGGLALALLFAIPFAAQQQAPFDESRVIADLTNALQLTSEQTSKLTDLISKRRPRIDDLLRQMSQFAPGSPNHNELRGQLDRERRSLMEELAPSLKPDQQTRLRGLLAQCRAQCRARPAIHRGRLSPRSNPICPPGPSPMSV